jgi:hypothetical protein
VGEDESVKTVVDRSLDLKHAWTGRHGRGHHYTESALKDKANKALYVFQGSTIILFSVQR